MNIVVLGGGIDTAGNVPSHVIARLEKAKELYESEPSSLIILSGKYSYLYTDQKPAQTEAETMSTYLQKSGVPVEKIICEKHSQDTISNAYFLKIEVFMPRGITSAVIITSEFQRERAEYIFGCICGPEYEFTYEAVPEDMNPSDRERLVHYQRGLLSETKKFLGPMKPGDHAYVADKFYTAPYYTKRQRPSWVADFVAKGTWEI